MIDRSKWDRHNKEVYNHFSRDRKIHKPWHEREFYAQMDRAPLEWGNEEFWYDNYDKWKYHFAHVSIEDPSLVAYTPNDEKGERNIQTRIKPGRYLKEFFSDLLSEKEIAHYASMHANGQKPQTPWDEYDFGLAASQKEIAEVYIHGPSSCMDSRHFKAVRTHPCRVYAGGDLAIAYLKGEAPKMNADRARVYVARALVWPEKKFYSRIYPTPDFYRQDGFETSHDAIACQNALLKRLQKEGYKSGSLDGARLLKLKRKTDDGYDLKNGVYMPYVDGGYRIFEKSDHLLLDKNGDFVPGNQTGHLELRHPYDCGRCGVNIPERDVFRVFTAYQENHDYWIEQTWCRTCNTEHTYRCVGACMIVADTNPYEIVEGHTYSVAWLDVHGQRNGIRWSGWKEPEKRTRKAKVSSETHWTLDTASPTAREVRVAENIRNQYAGRETVISPANYANRPDSMQHWSHAMVDRQVVCAALNRPSDPLRVAAHILNAQERYWLEQQGANVPRTTEFWARAENHIRDQNQSMARTRGALTQEEAQAGRNDITHRQEPNYAAPGSRAFAEQEARILADAYAAVGRAMPAVPPNTAQGFADLMAARPRPQPTPGVQTPQEWAEIAAAHYRDTLRGLSNPAAYNMVIRPDGLGELRPVEPTPHGDQE